MRPPGWNKTVRERAEAMPPHEARDYLLCVLENTAAALVLDAPHEVDRVAPWIRASQRRLLVALWDAQGRSLSKEACLRAMCIGYSFDEMPLARTVDVQICLLRKSLPDSVKIETIHGIGYRLIRKEQGT
jgi:DNA-binding response OmpR family regulator